MTKTIKKTKKKSATTKKECNQLLSKKIKKRFGGVKTKDIGGGMMEISFK